MFAQHDPIIIVTAAVSGGIVAVIVEWSRCVIRHLHLTAQSSGLAILFGWGIGGMIGFAIIGACADRRRKEFQDSAERRRRAREE